MSYDDHVRPEAENLMPENRLNFLPEEPFEFLNCPDLCVKDPESDAEVSTDCSPVSDTNPVSGKKTNLLKEVEISNFFAQEFQKNFSRGQREGKNANHKNLNEVKLVSELDRLSETSSSSNHLAKSNSHVNSDDFERNLNFCSSSELKSEKKKEKFLSFTSFLKNNWNNKVKNFKESRRRKLLSKINFLQNNKINNFDLGNGESRHKNYNNENGVHNQSKSGTIKISSMLLNYGVFNGCNESSLSSPNQNTFINFNSYSKFNMVDVNNFNNGINFNTNFESNINNGIFGYSNKENSYNNIMGRVSGSILNSKLNSRYVHSAQHSSSNLFRKKNKL